MFSCARVNRDLIIQVNFKRALLCASGVGALLAFLLWLGWFVLVKIEAERLRQEIYQSIGIALTTSIQQSFDKNHSTLLKLEACQAQLNSSKAISSDLAKMVNKKISNTKEEEPRER